MTDEINRVRTLIDSAIARAEEQGVKIHPDAAWTLSFSEKQGLDKCVCPMGALVLGRELYEAVGLASRYLNIPRMAVHAFTDGFDGVSAKAVADEFLDFYNLGVEYLVKARACLNSGEDAPIQPTSNTSSTPPAPEQAPRKPGQEP